MSDIVGSRPAPEMLQFLSASVDEAPQGILAFDLDFRFVIWNRELERLSGLSRGEILGKCAFETFPFLIATGENASLRAVLQGEHVSSKIRPYITPAGNSGYFDADYRPIRNESGEVIGGIAYVQEVSERVQAEAANSHLKDEIGLVEDRLKLITTTTDVGTWYCDLPFDVLQWSTKTKEHFWLPPDAVVTIDTFYERIHPNDREKTRQAIARSIAENGVYDIDYRTVSEDGRVKWIRALGRAFYDSAGNPIRFDGFTVDQTDRYNAEETLRRTERLATAGRLAATVAHEVNNPLEAVTNLVYLCQHDPEASERIRKNLKLAEEELGRVAHIVRQTLGFHRQTAAPEITHIAVLVRDLVEMYQRRFAAARVELKVDLDEAISVPIVAGTLRQVVANLLSNALDACSAGDEVSVSLRCMETTFQIAVADTGRGISAEHSHRLFEAFFTTKSDVGTGLGLWVSKGLVENQGGTLTVESSTEAHSHGTVFTITLPFQQASLGSC